MKSFILVFLYAFCIVGHSQSKSILEVLDTLPGNEKRLSFLAKKIDSEVYANPENVTGYAAIFDSIAEHTKAPEWHAEALNYKGVAYYVNQEYDKAIEYYLEATRYFEETNNGLKLYRIYNNLAACYNIRNDLANTEKYFLKSLEIASLLGDANWVANINNNLAVLYMNHQLYEKADEAINNALSYYQNQKDSLMLGITFMNLGNSKIYQNQYNEALNSYTQAMRLVPYDKVPLLYAVSETGIGIVNTKKKEYEKALPHLTKGVEIAKNINHVQQLMESYSALSTYYSETNNFKEAYFLSQESQKLKDSVLTAAQDQNMAEALTKFESEKKDAQLKLMKLEAEKVSQQQKLYLLFAIAGLLIAGLIGFFLFKNKKKNTLLGKQKKLLECTVDEKNVLLKETHHRVKNSFQIVSSLLYLQSENIKDKEAKLAMKDAQNRVRSMVLIHQKLYSKDQLVGINTKEYFTDLVNDIFESHQFENQKIHYSLDVEPLVLDIETITPLGLILNELITNVIKHAFPNDNPKNSMKVSLKKLGQSLQLIVVDNGIGMAKDIPENSFGIKLIQALSKKLKAWLSFSENSPKGTLAILDIERFTEL
ncbi:MAG: histidine kinase dimerization/phosphoacceptor domain -containing protein [Flavobacteriaceae bacterium]